MTKFLFFTDIDGTLLRGNMPIPKKVKAAARRFADAGGMLTLSTGRSHISTERIAREMDVELPCILFSGAILYDFQNGGVVSGTPLPRPVLEKLAELAVRYPEFSVQAYSARRAYLLQMNEVLRDRGIREEIEPGMSAIADIGDPLYKLVMTCSDIPKLEECGATLFGDPGYHFAFASRHFVEVVAAGACKGSAVRTLAAKLGVPLSNTFAAGDAMTDLPMFQVCGRSFAVEGSPPALVEVSDYTIPPCAEGGMAQAFDTATALMAQSGQ